MDWESWRKHVDYVVETHGRWYGVADGDGTPIFDLPFPSSADTPEQWMESADIEITVPAITSDGVPNEACGRLVMSSLGDFDESGQMGPAGKDYMILAAWPGSAGVVRRGGFITHVTAQDPDGTGVPQELTIHALNIMDVWNTIPAVSWPAAWWGATPYEKMSDESGLEYLKPWKMARVELATHPMFTYKNGKGGFVIRRLAQESLDAAMSTQSDPDGTVWVDDPYVVVEVPKGDTTPEVSLDARDGMLWETVAAQAKNAGLTLGAYLWWPGDSPVRTWSQVSSSAKPEEVDITPSQVESKRSLGEYEYPHAMIVLTVREAG